MIRLQLQLELAYTVLPPGADFFFYIHAARTAHQVVPYENLTISQSGATWDVQQSQNVGQRCLRLHAQPGPLRVQYQATVEISHHLGDPLHIPEVPVHLLPLEVLHFIYPSRYCQSDRLSNYAVGLFGQLPQGYLRAQAICDWVRRHVTFRSNSSSGTTSAVDTLIERVGVCRDFAHLMIALCRAINLPARFVTGTDYGADPTLGPPDFHAYVEVYLGDRWYLFDPSGTASLPIFRCGPTRTPHTAGRNPCTRSRRCPPTGSHRHTANRQSPARATRALPHLAAPCLWLPCAHSVHAPRQRALLPVSGPSCAAQPHRPLQPSQ